MKLESWQLASAAEGLDLEVKAAQGRDHMGQLPESFWPTYSAMANTEGGIILLGVREDESTGFEVCGILDLPKVQTQLWSGLNNRQKVSSNILSDRDVKVTELSGKKVIRVHVPRATRFQLPVYLGANPFGNTYRRNFEGDYRCDDETVKRMLADQVEDARDSKLLENFDFDDLNMPTFVAYRAAFKAVKPDHPWVDLDHQRFLRSIGGWTRNRETEREGLTLAGLLMFGRLPEILQAVPNYVVDYQERPPDSSEDSDRRWIDRITTDGSWSGNLYDFYRQTIQRLTRDLKVPFKLAGTIRIDDTPVHEAIREALTNLIIHADFTGRTSIYVIKRPDMFGFRNPGLMRVPLHLAIQGGNSDCRNRNLQKMFQLVGLAEQAGSGLPKVYTNWKKQHWRTPELVEQLDPDQTILRLRTLSLLPEETLVDLDRRFGRRFRELPELARLALATIAIEGSVSHARLKEMCAEHPKDISKILADLVDGGFVASQGATRGTIYSFPIQGELLGELTLQQTGPSFTHLAASSTQTVQDPRQNRELLQIAAVVRNSRHAPKYLLKSTIMALCRMQFLTAEQLASLLRRNQLGLQNHYLREMVAAGELHLLHPDQVTHPAQAYGAKKREV